jgi:hypothetical protein
MESDESSIHLLTNLSWGCRVSTDGQVEDLQAEVPVCTSR